MDKVTLVHGNFTDLSRLLDEAGVDKADGMLFDLGVSSPQLDDETRGFSYLKDAPLDMRMDASAPLTAQNVVNTWSQEELKRILRDYGEERYAAQIAAKIVRRREERPIETTLELAELGYRVTGSDLSGAMLKNAGKGGEPGARGGAVPVGLPGDRQDRPGDLRLRDEHRELPALRAQ